MISLRQLHCAVRPGRRPRVSDEAFDTLEQCLREYPVKTARDVLHIMGVIQYSNSAFKWPDKVASAEYSSLLSSLNDIAKLHPRRIPAVFS